MQGPGHQGPARVVRVRTRAASVASFGYIHEAEERSKIIFFFDSMQGVNLKNYFFPSLLCFVNLNSCCPSGRLLCDTEQMLD